MHRQPTPKSVTQAQEQLREISDKDAEAYLQAMDRAVAADEAGTLAECEKALTDARGIVDRLKPPG
jgi:hypothetical protein